MSETQKTSTHPISPYTAGSRGYEMSVATRRGGTGGVGESENAATGVLDTFKLLGPLRRRVAVTVFEDVSRILDEHDAKPKAAWFFVNANEWKNVRTDLLAMMGAFYAANIITGLISPLVDPSIKNLIDENRLLGHLLSRDDEGHLIRGVYSIRREAMHLAAGSNVVVYDPVPKPTGQFALGEASRVQVPPFIDEGEIVIVNTLLTCDLIAGHCLMHGCTSELSNKAHITGTNQFVMPNMWDATRFQDFLSGISLQAIGQTVPGMFSSLQSPTL